MGSLRVDSRRCRLWFRPGCSGMDRVGPLLHGPRHFRKTANRFAGRVDPAQGEPVDLFTRVCELGLQRIPKCQHPVRVVLVELMTQHRDRFSYSHLYTDLSPQQADAEAVFHRYNQPVHGGLDQKRQIRSVD